MKNRHGVDVQPGQVWIMPREGVEGVVMRIYPHYKGYCVVLSHPLIWGKHTESHKPLSAFSNRPRGHKSMRMKPPPKGGI
jgi:hypothetical protein